MAEGQILSDAYRRESYILLLKMERSLAGLGTGRTRSRTDPNLTIRRNPVEEKLRLPGLIGRAATLTWSGGGNRRT